MSRVPSLVISLALIALLVYLSFTALTAQQRVLAEQTPRKLTRTLTSDNKTHIIYLYFCQGGPLCELVYQSFFLTHREAWIANISASSVDAGAVNYATVPERGKEIFEAIRFPEERFGENVVAIYNNHEGLALSPAVGGDVINSAVHYFVYGTPFVHRVSSNVEKETGIISKPFIFFMGLTTGINPCLIALLCFLLVSLIQSGRKRMAKRVLAVASGLIYIQLVLVFTLLSVPNIAVYFSLATPLIISALFVLGALHLFEVGYDLYNRRQGQSSLEAKLPPFRTPQKLKDIVKKMAVKDNYYLNFTIGALFGLVKLPCFAAAYFPIFLSSSGDMVLNTAIFYLGATLPIVVIASLISIGVLKSTQLYAIRFKEGTMQKTTTGGILVLQRTVIGVILVVVALLYLVLMPV